MADKAAIEGNERVSSYPEPIRTRLEYLVYAAAVRAPAMLDEAERFVGGMLVENRPAADRARRFLSQEPSVQVTEAETQYLADILDAAYEDENEVGRRMIDNLRAALVAALSAREGGTE